MNSDDETQAPVELHDRSLIWFAALERARERNDFELAAKAERELEHLGVVVKFIRPRLAAEAD